jgi:predicted ATPase/DNA-binding SARP family transcriptional activator/tetratricopeptide (TPR) repeat protein
MRFGILGTTQAWLEDGSEVAVGGPARRALLALLLVRAGAVVSVDGLVEDLYGERAPRDAAHALQAQVSRLRRGLPGVTIELLPAGYRLAAGAEDVDAGRFERMAEQGRRALEGGRPREAAGILGAALGLWRGAALADVPETASARAVAQRLEELRAGAVEDRAEARLRLGEPGSAPGDPGEPGGAFAGTGEPGGAFTEAGGGLGGMIAELRELAQRHPLRERTCGLLMRALRDAGRGAEALSVFAGFRERLAGELGVDPSEELAALHVSLLRGERGPARPSRLTSFVGRSRDVAGVGELLARARLVTLHGPGGVGKTRLAVEAVAYRPDVCFVRLAALRDPAELPHAMLAALALREDGPPVARLVAALSGRSALLVLDNCEHLVQAVAELAEEVLVRCPSVRILTTSREPLGVTGEHLWPVPTLAPAAAARLFVDRAAAVRPGFAMDPGNASTIEEICRRLDGLPLAIELAASRVRTLEVAELAERLADRFAVLSRGSRTAEPRHRTLRGAVAWSWDLLSGAERTALRRASVFAGGSDLPAAARVCAVAQVGDVLDSLVDKSLLAVDGGRYRMLDTVMAYAGERLDEAGESAAVRRVHAEYFLGLARSADARLRGAGQLSSLRVFGEERDNVRAALRWAVGARETGTALRLVAAMATHLWMSGTDTAVAAQAMAILEQLDGPPPDLVNEYLLCVPTAAAGGSGSQVWARYGAAARSAALAADRPLHPVTALLWSLAGTEEVTPVVHELARRGRTSPDAWEAAAAHLIGGYPRLLEAGAEAAEREFAAAAEGFRSLGDRWGTAMALGSLAGLADLRADHARAVALSGEALGLTREVGALEELCDLLCDRGDYRLHEAAAAAQRPRETTGTGTGAGDRLHEAAVAGARADFEEAVRLATRLGRPAHRAAAQRGLGDVARLEGDGARARRLYDEALGHFDVRWVKSAANRVGALTGLGRIAEAGGDLAGARARYLKAIEVAAGAGTLPSCARAVEALAGLARREGDAGAAGTLLEAASALRGTARTGEAGTVRRAIEGLRAAGVTVSAR